MAAAVANDAALGPHCAAGAGVADRLLTHAWHTTTTTDHAFAAGAAAQHAAAAVVTLSALQMQ